MLVLLFLICFLIFQVGMLVFLILFWFLLFLMSGGTGRRCRGGQSPPGSTWGSRSPSTPGSTRSSAPASSPPASRVCCMCPSPSRRWSNTGSRSVLELRTFSTSTRRPSGQVEEFSFQFWSTLCRWLSSQYFPQNQTMLSLGWTLAEVKIHSCSSFILTETHICESIRLIGLGTPRFYEHYSLLNCMTECQANYTFSHCGCNMYFQVKHLHIS